MLVFREGRSFDLRMTSSQPRWNETKNKTMARILSSIVVVGPPSTWRMPGTPSQQKAVKQKTTMRHVHFGCFESRIESAEGMDSDPINKFVWTFHAFFVLTTNKDPAEEPPWYTNSLPLKICHPERKFIFQPSIFRCYSKLVSGSVSGAHFLVMIQSL